MKIPYFSNLFKQDAAKKPDIRSFSDFFLHASDAEKTAVLTEAAHRANKEQMRIFTAANVTTHSR